MSTSITVVSSMQPEVTALAKLCEDSAAEKSLDRYEIAVQSRLKTGIGNDNDLRLADELLVNVMRGADAVDAVAKPYIAAAHALHKSMIATAQPWKTRWAALADSLKGVILKYQAAKAELARRQQAELDKATEEARRRVEAEARAALRNGDVTAATEALQRAQDIVPVAIMPATPVLEYSRGHKHWEVEVVDPMALVKKIAAGTVPLEAIGSFDLVFLRREAIKRGGLPISWLGPKTAPCLRVNQVDSLAVRR